MMLLFIGLMAASNNLQYQGLQMASNEIVPMPKIGMPSMRGPWPKCIGMTGEACASYIEENAKELTIELIPYGAVVTQDFRTDRVRVFVNSNDIVVEAPGRG